MDDFSLNALGILCGTDKSQLGFDYLRHYDRSLSRFRGLPINVVEIGVFNGASAKMWKRFFPKATIIGVDIQERCKSFEEERIKIEIGSQSDGDFIDDVITKYPPTVMIDDGSHIASDIIFTFERAFTRLLPGGCYIVEDLLFHAGTDAARHRGSASMGAQDYFLIFAKQLLDGQIDPTHQNDRGLTLTLSIDRIEIIGRAAFVWKKEPDPFAADYEWLELLVQRGGAANNWGLLATYILRMNGPMANAERAARAAVAADGDNWSYQFTLAQVLEKGGHLGEAAVWFERAAPLAPESWRTKILANLDRIRQKI